MRLIKGGNHIKSFFISSRKQVVWSRSGSMNKRTHPRYKIESFPIFPTPNIHKGAEPNLANIKQHIAWPMMDHWIKRSLPDQTNLPSIKAADPNPDGGHWMAFLGPLKWETMSQMFKKDQDLPTPWHLGIKRKKHWKCLNRFLKMNLGSFSKARHI